MVDYFDLIDDYMDDTLSPEDKSNFEAAMAVDTKLAHAVENYPLLKNLSASLIEDEVRQHIETLKDGKQDKKEVSKNMPFRKYLTVAASVAVLLLSTYFINNYFAKINNDLIVDNLYQRPYDKVSRGEEEELNRIDNAIDLFNKNDFEASKSLFSQKPENDSLSKVADFYLANIAFYTEDYTTSEKLFLSLASHQNYTQDAQLNLMTIYLITNQKDKGRILYMDLLKQNILSQSQKAFIENVLKE